MVKALGALTAGLGLAAAGEPDPGHVSGSRNFAASTPNHGSGWLDAQGRTRASNQTWRNDPGLAQDVVKMLNTATGAWNHTPVVVPGGTYSQEFILQQQFDCGPITNSHAQSRGNETRGGFDILCSNPMGSGNVAITGGLGADARKNLATSYAAKNLNPCEKNTNLEQEEPIKPFGSHDRIPGPKQQNYNLQLERAVPCPERRGPAFGHPARADPGRSRNQDSRLQFQNRFRIFDIRCFPNFQRRLDPRRHLGFQHRLGHPDNPERCRRQLQRPERDVGGSRPPGGRAGGPIGVYAASRPGPG